MSPVDEKKLPKWKWLEACAQGELVRGQFLETVEWGIVGSRGNDLLQLVVLTGSRAPYWMNAYSPNTQQIMAAACLSYGADWRLIPDYTAAIEPAEVGGFTIREDGEYGIVVGGPPGSSKKGHLDLKKLTVGGERGGNFLTLWGWSIWKDGLTAKGEPFKLVEFPPKAPSGA